MAKFCKHCGSSLTEGKKFCAKCGTPTGVPADTWTCLACGHKNTKGKFCAKCGNGKPDEASIAYMETPMSQSDASNTTNPPQNAPLVPTSWLCPACGHENAKGKFCAKCGEGNPEETLAAPVETPVVPVEMPASQPDETATAPAETPAPPSNDANIAVAETSPSANAWVCPACGHENAKGKFCTKCGGGKPVEIAVSPVETPTLTPTESVATNTPSSPPLEPPITAPPLPEPPAPAPTEALQNSFEAPPAQTPKARNNKSIILIVALVIVAVAAFFGSSKLTESLYASKVEESASVMTESKTLLDSLAELPADAASDDVKKVASDLAKNAEKLNSIHGGLLGKLPMKPSQEKAWEAIGKNAELLSKATAMIQSQERAFSPSSIKHFAALCDECMTKLDEANTAATYATVKNQPLSALIPYAEIKNNLQIYRQNKQTFDAKLAQDKNNKEQKKHQEQNNELKKKPEVVFLAENAHKNGNDLILSGRFFNGTPDLVTSIMDMQIDLKVSLFGTEVQSLKDEPFSLQMSGLRLMPQQVTDVVQLRLPGKAPEGDFNEFEAHVHKIRWSRLKAR